MVQAATTALSTVAGAISNQPRRQRDRIPLQSSTSAIALSKDNKAAKLALKNAREERLYDLISQPEILGFGMTFAGILAAQMIPFSSNKGVNEMLQATATSASVIMGMGYAGVGDLTTAIIAGLAGVSSLLEGVSLPHIPDYIPDPPALPGLTQDESKEVYRKALWQGTPMGIGSIYNLFSR